MQVVGCALRPVLGKKSKTLSENQPKVKRADCMAPVVEYLPGKGKALSSIPSNAPNLCKKVLHILKF
jgi:hypothetical protein